MGDVRLAVLGPPEVLHVDKALALLISVVAEGRVHLRKRLSELFWPDQDTTQGHETGASSYSSPQRWR